MATKAFQQKNYREAADGYGKALVLVPTDPEGYYRKGYAHFNLKEHDAAVKDFTTALSQGFKPPLDIYRVRHYILLEQKNYDAALADVQKGLETVPNDVSLLAAAGEIYFEKKAYNEALEALKKGAAASTQNNADFYYNMARVYKATGDSAAQAGAAETALAKGTRFPGEAFFLLGEAHRNLQNFPAAINAFQRAIGVKGDVYQAYRILSELLRAENRYNDAIETSKRGLIAFPNDGSFYSDLSLYYSLAERHTDAVAAGRAAVGISPNESSGYTNLCRAYNETKEYALAIGTCNTALRLKPNDGETLFYLGRAHNLSGNGVEASKLYARAVTGLLDQVAKDPKSSESWYLLGNAYFSDNQRDKAVDAYLKCLEISPKFAKARYNLGVIYTLKKNKAGAVEQYDRLASLDTRLAEKLRAEIDRM